MREYMYKGKILYLKCNKCGRFLTTENYNKDKTKLFGFRTNCNDCRKVWGKIYYKSNKEKIIERGKIWVENNKTKVDGYKKKYRENNRGKVAVCQKSNRERHNDELGFNRDTFHQRAIQFVRKYKLRPEICPICGSDKKVVMHHPFYDIYDDWKKVVFCCQSCHKKIHNGEIECLNIIYLD